MQARRRFLQCSVCTVLTLGCSNKEEADSDVATDSGEPPSDPVFDPCLTVADESWYTISFDDYPELLEVGGSRVLSVEGVALVIAQVEEGCYVALSSRCTHEGEEIYYQEQALRFVCPRHGAAFTISGEVISGPTSVALASYPTALFDGVLKIQL